MVHIKSKTNDKTTTSKIAKTTYKRLIFEYESVSIDV